MLHWPRFVSPQTGPAPLSSGLASCPVERSSPHFLASAPPASPSLSQPPPRWSLGIGMAADVPTREEQRRHRSPVQPSRTWGRGCGFSLHFQVRLGILPPQQKLPGGGRQHNPEGRFTQWKEIKYMPFLSEGTLVSQDLFGRLPLAKQAPCFFVKLQPAWNTAPSICQPYALPPAALHSCCPGIAPPSKASAHGLRFGPLFSRERGLKHIFRWQIEQELW